MNPCKVGGGLYMKKNYEKHLLTVWSMKKSFWIKNNFNFKFWSLSVKKSEMNKQMHRCSPINKIKTGHVTEKPQQKQKSRTSLFFNSKSVFNYGF